MEIKEKELLKDYELIEEYKKTPQKHLIFATSNLGNVFFLRDLKILSINFLNEFSFFITVKLTSTLSLLFFLLKLNFNIYSSSFFFLDEITLIAQPLNANAITEPAIAVVSPVLTPLSSFSEVSVALGVSTTVFSIFIL